MADIDLIPDPATDSVVSDFNVEYRIFDGEGLGVMISAAATWVSAAAALALFLCVAWSGGQIMFGAANKAALEKSRKRLTNCLIGMSVLFLAWAFILFIQYFVGLDDNGGIFR